MSDIKTSQKRKSDSMEKTDGDDLDNKIKHSKSSATADAEVQQEPGPELRINDVVINLPWDGKWRGMYDENHHVDDEVRTSPRIVGVDGVIVSLMTIPGQNEDHHTLTIRNKGWTRVQDLFENEDKD